MKDCANVEVSFSIQGKVRIVRKKKEVRILTDSKKQAKMFYGAVLSLIDDVNSSEGPEMLDKQNSVPEEKSPEAVIGFHPEVKKG